MSLQSLADGDIDMADLRAKVEANAAKAGFTPNVFLAYGYKPEHFRAFFHYYDVLMKGPSGLSRAEREMIVVAVSRVNGCTYCTVAHGAALRILSKNPVLADQISANYRAADVTPRQRAMLDFAVKVTERSSEIEQADFERLREHGCRFHRAWHAQDGSAFYALAFWECREGATTFFELWEIDAEPGEEAIWLEGDVGLVPLPEKLYP